MQIVGGAWAVWIVWAMLLAGAGLVLASLRHTSERFWYWKQARQMAAGEVAPSAEALRVGQRFRVLSEEDTAETGFALVPENAERTTRYGLEVVSAEAMTGRVVGMTRGLLLLLLEPETQTRDEENAYRRNRTVKAGRPLTVQITGDDALFRFTGVVRGVRPDPEQPFCTLVTVKLPFWLARIQRRQHVRAPIHAAVTLHGTNNSKAGKIPVELLRGTLRDLSGGGLCLELDGAQRPDTLARLCAEWNEGAVLECSLNMPLLRETPLRLRVHSCERIVVRGGLSLRIRGEFAHLPAWQQETLVSVVFQAQRQNLRQPAPRLQTAG